MGVNKRKRETEKIEKDSGAGSAPCFEELRDDLFREAAKLVAGDPSIRLAVFVGPPASEPDGPVYSFGYPSAEGVVRTFLEDNCHVPVPEEEDDVDDEEGDEEEDAPAPRRFWWEDPKLLETTDLEELDALYERLSRDRDRLALRLEYLQRKQGSENKG